MVQKARKVIPMTEERLKVPRVGVGIMILNENGEVLLGKRHDDPKEDMPLEPTG